MRTLTAAVALSLLSLSAVADAAPRAPNLRTTILAPSGVMIGANARYTVRITNVGNASATGVNVSIQLPVTATSPTVHILGDLGARHTNCSVAGTQLNCYVTGTLRAGFSSSVWFDIAFPYATVPLNITAAATPTAGDSFPADNTVTHTVALTAPALAITGPRQTLIRHCTGRALTSFFECELYPSSISEHETVLNADNSITIPLAPTYTGTWSQATSSQLYFQYFNGPDLQVTFNGVAVDGSCFEGRTTFPNSQYVSMYQVCLR